jgi:hypothetical protein
MQIAALRFETETACHYDSPMMGALCDAAALEKFWTEQELEFLFESPDEGGYKKKKKGLDRSDDLRYQIVIDCESESQQTSMLDRFEGRGIKCRPLIS